MECAYVSSPRPPPLMLNFHGHDQNPKPPGTPGNTAEKIMESRPKGLATKIGVFTLGARSYSSGSISGLDESGW